MSQINPVNKSLCLEKICETNFQKLFRLIPDLLSVESNAIGYSAGKPALHLKMIDKTSHTITLQLSHSFDKTLINLLEPDVKIRIYLDVKLAEVIRDHSKTDVFRIINRLDQNKEVLDYKWSLNYFLEKWLNHCLKKNYQFEIEELMMAEI